MFKVIKFLFLIAPVIALATNYPYPQSKASDFKLSSSNFKRYVIPQAKNITKDFYRLLINIDPTQEQIIEIKTEILKLDNKWKNWSKNCFDLKGNCQEIFELVYSQSRIIDKKLLSLKLNLSSDQNSKESSIDQQLKTVRAFNYISTLNYTFMHALEEIKITSDTAYGRLNSTISQTLLPLLNEMRVYSELQVGVQLPKEVRELFYNVWENFFKRLERHIIFGKKKLYLRDNLGQLNLTWNTFHMKVLKGNIKLSDKINRSISIMHSRWNSILKVTL